MFCLIVWFHCRRLISQYDQGARKYDRDINFQSFHSKHAIVTSINDQNYFERHFLFRRTGLKIKLTVPANTSIFNLMSI